MDSRSAKPRATSLGSPGAATSARHARGAEGWTRDRFCGYLRAERDRASLSIEDIARVTRIPEHSLRRLEAGEFEDLPGDVFVRGFLRSYARCVGLDAEEVVRRYSECGALAPAPVASDLARLAAQQAAVLARADEAEVVSRPSAGRPVGQAEKLAPAAASAGTPLAGVGPVAASGPPGRAGVVGSDEASGSQGSAGRAASGAAGTGAGERRAPTGDPAAARGSGSRRSRRDRRARRRAQTAAPHGVAASRATHPRHATASGERRRGDQSRRALPALPSGRARGLRRGPLFLAVAVVALAIAAILTMSYLLRRPGASDRAGPGAAAGSP
jgi:hypothetical protein